MPRTMTRHESELRRAHMAAVGYIRELIARYEATGRDYHSPERVDLEAALRRHNQGVSDGEHMWSYSRVEGSIVRARLREFRFARAPTVPAGTRVYRHAFYEDLSERTSLEIETTTGGGRV